MRLSRSEEEINEQLNKASDGMDNGSKYPGMSFEEGVSEAIRWIIGDLEDAPFSEE